MKKRAQPKALGRPDHLQIHRRTIKLTNNSLPKSQITICQMYTKLRPFPTESPPFPESHALYWALQYEPKDEQTLTILNQRVWEEFQISMIARKPLLPILIYME